MLRVAVLPLTKPDWAGWIRERRMLASLAATILERILTSRFRSEMGLNEPGSSGSFPFFESNFMMIYVLVGR